MSLEWRGASISIAAELPEPDQWVPVAVPGRPAQFAGADAVAYETTFDDPRDGTDEHVILSLDGSYAHTRVWCNGEQLAEHDAYFAPLRVRLPDASEYRIVVECRRPADRFGGLHDTGQLPPERCVPGIWWDATIETRPDPYVDSLRVDPRRTDEGATVDVTTEIVTTDTVDDRLMLSLRPEGASRGGGMMARSELTTGPGRATVQEQIDVREPGLWWTHDRGGQPRYTVRAKIGDDDQTVTTGLRTVRHDGDGFQLNGQRLPIRGVTVLDPTPEDVEQAVRANANMVRVRAQAVPPAVADACDRHGVLVWHDLPLTGPGAFDAERGRELAETLVRTYGHRPSFAAVGVHDSPVTSFARGLDSGWIDRLRFRWRAWRTQYDDGPATAIAETIDSVPTVPVTGPPGIDPDAVTLYPGWQYGTVEDLSWLCEHYDVGDMVGGFGAGSLGTESPADETGFDRASHDTHVDDGVEESQAYQASTVRRVAEQLRYRESELLCVETLRDVAGAGMGVRCVDGTEKAAFSALATSYEPTQIILTDPTPGETDIVVIHDQPTNDTFTVEWDHNGERTQEEHTIGAFGRVTVGSLSLDAGDDVTLAVAVGDQIVKNEYDIA